MKIAHPSPPPPPRVGGFVSPRLALRRVRVTIFTRAHVFRSHPRLI